MQINEKKPAKNRNVKKLISWTMWKVFEALWENLACRRLVVDTINKVTSFYVAAMSEMVHQTLFALEIIYAKTALSARKYWINNRNFL